jgi:hypothetical protein
MAIGEPYAAGIRQQDPTLPPPSHVSGFGQRWNEGHQQPYAGTVGNTASLSNVQVPRQAAPTTVSLNNTRIYHVFHSNLALRNSPIV